MEKPFYIKSFRGDREICDIIARAGFPVRSDASIMASLVALAHFLEEHKLVASNLLINGQLRDGKKFELWSTDLTQEGLAVIRAGLGNWEKKGCPETDIRPLERAFKKVTATLNKRSEIK